MANKNAFAIVAIALALIIGVIVGVGIVGTILLFLYGIVVSVFRNAFGIDLRTHSRGTMPATIANPVTSR